MTPPYLFPKALQEATVISRPNRFIVWADLDGQTVKCHCPVSGRIGGLTIDGLKVLLSGPYEGRGTAYTVEAVALEPKESPTFQWIGLNQSRCNAVVEHFLKTGAMKLAFPEAGPATVRREKALADSRIDFLVDDKTFIEVKMPLLKVHAARSASVPLKEFPQGNPSERLPKQMLAMTEAITEGYRGAMVICFQYENTADTPQSQQVDENIFPDASMLTAKAAGLEQWLLTVTIDPQGIYFKALTPYKNAFTNP